MAIDRVDPEKRDHALLRVVASQKGRVIEAAVQGPIVYNDVFYDGYRTEVLGVICSCRQLPVPASTGKEDIVESIIADNRAY